MKRIGLTQRVQVITSYNERRDALDQRWYDLVFNLGYLPVVLPNIDPSKAVHLVNEYNLDGIILTGGNSLHILEPNNPNVAPERDKFETELISLSIKNNIPILGVCRGMQIINSYFGGTFKKVPNHVACKHELKSKSPDFDFPNSVNSFHDWGIPSSGLAINLKPLACDVDENIEAFRHRDFNIFGIMWHPERTLQLSLGEIDFIKRIFS